MKKRGMALALVMMLTLVLVCPSAQAAGVYFVGAEENILPLTEDTMPFWNNGYLYVAGSIFTGTTRESLKISHVSTRGGKRMIFYRNERHLLFEQENSYALDESGNTYYPGAVVRNGVMFVPVSLVAEYFGLEYSVTAVRYGYLIWLRKPSFGLSADHFADAASASIQDRYNDYARSLEAPETPEQPGTANPETAAVSGKRLYLCFRAEENVPELMDTLERFGAQATFFCTTDYLADHDDVLRRMTGSGHSVAILADEEEAYTLAEQLHDGNQALVQATGQKTRLARLENAGEEELEAARAAGYCLSASAVKPARYTLANTYQAERLFQSVSVSRGGSCIWLSQTSDVAGLARFLTLAAAAEDSCLALTETAVFS